MNFLLLRPADYSIIRSSITHAHEHSDRDDSGSRLMRAPDQANPCQIGCWWIPDKRPAAGAGVFHRTAAKTLTTAPPTGENNKCRAHSAQGGIEVIGLC
jgi:hypothetical protein